MHEGDIVNISTIGGTRAFRAIDAARAAGDITEIDGTSSIEAIESINQ